MSAQHFQSVLNTFSLWMIPVLFVSILVMGLWRRVNVYESFVEGGKDGFATFLRILPYLVAIFIAIGMVRECGLLDMIANATATHLKKMLMPTDVLPVALMRSLSGGGSFGIVAEIIKADPNGYSAFVAATVYGSSETTFYVIALYFGSIGIKKIRHALLAGLIADFVGIVAALIVCYYMFNGAEYFKTH